MVNLHTHSEYSYKDAISKVEEIALRQKEMGFQHFCITDHGTLTSFPDAFAVSKKLGMHFIPGVELYLKPSDEFDLKNKVLEVSNANKILRQKRSTVEQKAEARNIIDKWEDIDAKKNFHITLIAYNQEGLENLFRIYSNGETYYKYRTPIESIINNKEGIIVLSGCMGGELAFYVKSRQMDLAEKLILKYKEIFGSNYYIEIQNHGMADSPKEKEKGYMGELETYLNIISLAEKFNVPMVATNDSHYTTKEDEDIHKIYKEICYNKTEDQLSGEMGFHGSGYHITTEKELKQRFLDAGYKNVESMFENVKNIVSMVEGNLDIEKSSSLSDKNELLREKVLEGWEELRKGTKYEEQSMKQLEWELSVIEGKNYSNYFLDVKKIVKRAYDLKILVGPGRGSGAGSEVNYLLKITKVDPLKYGLIFERFMNPSRFAMPDIDLDLESRMKIYDGKLGSDLVMKSLVDTFKFHGRIANVVTGSTLSLFKKLASYFQVPYAEANKFTTTDISKELLTLKSKPKEEVFIQKLTELGLTYTKEWKSTYKYLDVCYKLNGIAFGSSIHASGKIMTEDETNLPVNDEKVINFNGENLEKYGYTKFDLLSLTTLSIIRDIYGLDIDWENVEDENAWKVLNEADTEYVFQLGGDIPKMMLKEVEITSIDQLAEISAINRPGPLALGLHNKWIDAHKGKATFTKEEKVISELLKNAFGESHTGLVIYQEDVMKIFQDGAGFSLGESDNIRRAMGKKNEELMKSFKPRFLKDWKLGGDPEIIWENIAGFARYAFNKSHAIAYSLVSFQTAKIWANHKERYLEWVINNSSGPKKKAALETCKKLGWKLVFPTFRDIKISEEYRIKDGIITPPINYDGKFNSVSEFLFGELTKIEKGNLILMGVLDEITPDRFALLSIIQAIPDSKLYNPAFPETDSIFEIIENGELLDLWDVVNEEADFYDLRVHRARSVKDIRLYKNKSSLPDDRLQYNVKQDMKYFGLVKGGQLSEFPTFDTDRVIMKFNKYKELLIRNTDMTNQRAVRSLRYSLRDELNKILMEPFYKNKIDKIRDIEYTALFNSNKNNPNYGYSKTVIEFNDGEHIFWPRNKELIASILPLNKGTICRVYLFLDWYINKNLEPVFLFKLKSIMTE